VGSGPPPGLTSIPSHSPSIIPPSRIQTSGAAGKPSYLKFKYIFWSQSYEFTTMYNASVVEGKIVFLKAGKIIFILKTRNVL
jgi:hypothetical protein